MHQDQFAKVVRYMQWLLSDDSRLLQVFFQKHEQKELLRILQVEISD